MSETLMCKNAGNQRGKNASIHTRFNRNSPFGIIQILFNLISDLTLMPGQFMKTDLIDIRLPILRKVVRHDCVSDDNRAILSIKCDIGALTGNKMFHGMVIQIKDF